MRPLALLVVGVALTGCGGSTRQTTTSGASAPPVPGHTLYAGGDWAVALDGDRATAFHRVGGTWKKDTSGAVKIRILGPEGTALRTPQVAAEISATRPLIESGMWVDGKELPVKGGGLTTTRGTIYGAPGAPLRKGMHVAVAYGRTSEHATAVGWTFRVK